MELWDRSRPSINCNAIPAKIKLAGVINYSIRMPLTINGATIVAPNTKSYPTCEYVVYLLPCRILKGLWLTLTPTDLALIIFTHGVFFAYLVYPYLFWIRCIDLHFMCFIDTNLLSNIQFKFPIYDTRETSALRSFGSRRWRFIVQSKGSCVPISI